MTYSEQVNDARSTQENLNPSQSIIPILKRGEETILVEEGPTFVQKTDLTNFDGFILGSSLYGVLGTNKLGATGIAFNNQQVYNKNNEFIWDFRFNTSVEEFGRAITKGFTNTNETTASIDTTTLYNITFAGTQTWQSESIYLTQDNNQIVTAIEVVPVSTGALSWSASADGGQNYISITPNVNTTIVQTGTNLLVRAVSSGSATLEQLRVRYDIN